MFSYQMSYDELVVALSRKVQQKKDLTTHELLCIDKSLQSPYLQDMLELYPLHRSFESLIQKKQNIEFDVHSKIYQGPRNKLKSYLEKEFPPRYSSFVNDMLSSFIEESLLDPIIQEQLVLAEKGRYQERVGLFEKREIFFIRPLSELDVICADFHNYIKELERYHNINPRIWPVLESLLLRFFSLEESNEKDEARLTLILALDDARTAYHTARQSLAHSCYTCMKGLQEILLGHHQRVILVTNQLTSRQTFLMTLYEPFVQSYANPDLSRTYSDLLYKLYLKAVGATVKTSRKTVYCFKKGVDINDLKQKYLTQFESLPRKKMAESFFNNIVQQIQTKSLFCSEARSPVLDFLIQNHAVLTNKVIYEGLTFRAQEKRDADIFNHMLAKGPFIDRGHLKTVLALSDLQASFETMRQVARLQTLPQKKHTKKPRREAMIAASCEYALMTASSHINYLSIALSLPYTGCYFYCSQELLAERFESAKSLAMLEPYTVLNYLVETGYSRALEALLAVKSFKRSTYDLSVALRTAAKNGHIRIVEILIAHGAPLDFDDHENFTALLHAVIHHHTPIVDLLLSHGAAMNTRCRSAMIEAASHGYTDLMELLISYGAIVDEVFSGNSPLRSAVIAGHVPAIELLLKSGARFDQKTMTEAVEKGSKEVIDCLIKAGAPLPWALRTLWPLLQYGTVHIDKPDQKGRTSLMRAVLERNLSDLRQLLQEGACPNKRSLEGRTALDYAVCLDDPDAVKELQCFPMTPRTQIVALRLAIYKKKYNIASLLYHTPLAPIMAKRERSIKCWYEEYIQRNVIFDSVCLAPQGAALSFSQKNQSAIVPARQVLL